MQKSAIAAGVVDFALPPDGIALVLRKIAASPHLIYSEDIEEAEDIFPAIESITLRKIIAQLRSATGVDFNHYKKATIKRRIVRRMVIHKLESPEAYAQLL